MPKIHLTISVVNRRFSQAELWLEARNPAPRRYLYCNYRRYLARVSACGRDQVKANLRLRSLRTNLRDPRSGPCFRAKSGDRVRDRSSPSRARGDPPADREGSGRNGRDLTGARGEGARRLRKRGQAPFGRGKAPVRGQNVPCYGRQSSLLRDRNLPVNSASPRRRAGPFSSDRTGSFRQ